MSQLIKYIRAFIICLIILVLATINQLSNAQPNYLSQITTGVSNPQHKANSSSATTPMPFAISANQSKDLFVYAENFKYGYTDASGKLVVPAVFQYAKEFVNEHAIIYYKGKIGVINKNGQEITQFKYQNIKNFSENLAAVSLQNKWGYIDTKGMEIIACQYMYAGNFIQNLAVVGNNNKYGIINKKNELVLPLVYDDVQVLSDACIAFRKKNKWTIENYHKKSIKEIDYFGPIKNINGFYVAGLKNQNQMMYGIMDSAGEYQITPEYLTIEVHPESRQIKTAIIDSVKRIKFGIIDFNNQIVAPFIFDYMGNYSNGCAVVKINTQFGIVNNGKYIMLKKAKWLENKGSYYSIYNNGYYGVSNKDGQVIIEPKYPHIEFAGDYFFITEKGKYGVWNNKGIRIHAPEYDKIFRMNDSLCLANASNKWILLDLKGDKKNLAKYHDAEILSSIYIKVKLKNLYGVVNDCGVEIIPCKYSELLIGDNDVFSVCLNGMWGFINDKNETIIEFKFNNAGAFSNGLAWFQNQKRYGFIDITGHSVIPAQYEAAKPYINKIAAVKLKNKWGFVDYAGNIVIPCKFDYVESFTSNVVNAQIKGKKVLLYADGKIVKK